MKQVSQAPQRPSSINPQVSPALDAVVMRALEKDPGQRFQSAEAFIAALDAALRDPGAQGGGTAAFAPLPPVVAVAGEARGEDPEEEERDAAAGSSPAVVAAILIGALLGLLLTRDTTTDVPDVTGNSRQRARTSGSNSKGFKIGDRREVRTKRRPDTVLEQEPLPGEASLDCAFLGFFCSKPEVVLTVSAGPGSGKVPSTAGLPEEDAEDARRRRLRTAGAPKSTPKRSNPGW